MTENAKYIELTCPFCTEGDFDALGLKQHLLRGWCKEFEKIGRDCTEPECPYFGKPRPGLKSCSCAVLS